MRAVNLACCLSLLAASAMAQGTAPTGKPDPVEVRNLSASYELTNADSTLRCPIALEPKPAGRGLFLNYDRDACRSRFGFLSEVSSWLPGIAGAILLVAPDGRVVTEFTEGVGGVYEAIREGDGVYFLANLQFVDPAERVQAKDLMGEWLLARPDAPPEGATKANPKAPPPPKPCTLALTDEVVGDQLFNLRIQPPCDPALVPAGLQSWQLERGDIVLRFANGDSLRFEKADETRWNKVPEKPRPLVLSRP
jgi:hypothetical protein